MKASILDDYKKDNDEKRIKIVLDHYSGFMAFVNAYEKEVKKMIDTLSTEATKNVTRKLSKTEMKWYLGPYVYEKYKQDETFGAVFDMLTAFTRTGMKNTIAAAINLLIILLIPFFLSGSFNCWIRPILAPTINKIGTIIWIKRIILLKALKVNAKPELPQALPIKTIYPPTWLPRK